MSTTAQELETVKAHLLQTFADTDARGSAVQKAVDAGYAARQISNDIQERFGVSRSVDEILACLGPVQVNLLTRQRRVTGVLELAGVPVRITTTASHHSSFNLTSEAKARDVSHPAALISCAR